MKPYTDIISNSSEKHGVPYNILASLLENESTFNPRAISKSGAQGIAQFMPEISKYHKIDPFDPNQSISKAAEILKHNYDVFGDWKLAIAAYNSGIKGVSGYNGKLPKGLQDYVDKIISKANYK